MHTPLEGAVVWHADMHTALIVMVDLKFWESLSPNDTLEYPYCFVAVCFSIVTSLCIHSSRYVSPGFIFSY